MGAVADRGLLVRSRNPRVLRAGPDTPMADQTFVAANRPP